MNPPQPTVALQPTAAGHTTSADQRVYGLIEWDDPYRLTVIVGCCRRTQGMPAWAADTTW